MTLMFVIIKKTNLRFKKLKAKRNPTLKNNIKPNKTLIDIQKKCPSKFKLRFSRVVIPIVVFVEPSYRRNIGNQE